MWCLPWKKIPVRSLSWIMPYEKGIHQHWMMQAERGIHCWTSDWCSWPTARVSAGQDAWLEMLRGKKKRWWQRGWLQMTVAFTSGTLIPGLCKWCHRTHLGILNLFDMWRVMGRGCNFPSSSDKAIGSMTFSPICLSLPYLQLSLRQICPGLQPVQSTWKSGWVCWLQIIPTGWGTLDKHCWGVAGTAQHGAWQDGARAAG